MSTARIATTMVSMARTNVQRAVHNYKLRQEEGEQVMLATEVILSCYEALLRIESGSKAVALNGLINARPEQEQNHYRQAKHFQRILISMYGPKAA